MCRQPQPDAFCCSHLRLLVVPALYRSWLIPHLVSPLFLLFFPAGRARGQLRQQPPQHGKAEPAPGMLITPPEPISEPRSKSSQHSHLPSGAEDPTITPLHNSPTPKPAPRGDAGHPRANFASRGQPRDAGSREGGDGDRQDGATGDKGAPPRTPQPVPTAQTPLTCPAAAAAPPLPAPGGPAPSRG